MGITVDRFPQGSVLDPSLFNIYINDLFYAAENSSIFNFADDTSPYSCGYKVNKVMRDAEVNCATLVTLFKDIFWTPGLPDGVHNNRPC